MQISKRLAWRLGIQETDHTRIREDNPITQVGNLTGGHQIHHTPKWKRTWQGQGQRQNLYRTDTMWSWQRICYSLCSCLQFFFLIIKNYYRKTLIWKSGSLSLIIVSKRFLMICQVHNSTTLPSCKRICSKIKKYIPLPWIVKCSFLKWSTFFDSCWCQSVKLICFFVKTEWFEDRSTNVTIFCIARPQ